MQKNKHRQFCVPIIIFRSFFFQIKQDSPPAGNRKRCTTRGIICSSMSYPGGTPSLTSGGGVPHPGWRRWGTPIWDLTVWNWDTPPTWYWGTPLGWDLGPVTGVPLWKGHGTSGSIMGWRCGTQLGVNTLKTLPPVVLLNG